MPLKKVCVAFSRGVANLFIFELAVGNIC